MVTDWKLIYTLASKIVLDTYLIPLQYKIIYRVFNCKYKLYLWNVVDSPNCYLCNKIDNLEHYFFCDESNLFWKQVESWLTKNYLIKFKFTILEILLGLHSIEIRYYYPVNYLIMLGKYYIFQSKQKKTSPFCYSFLLLVKDKTVVGQLYLYNKG